MSMTAQLRTAFSHHALDTCGATFSGGNRRRRVRECLLLALLLCVAIKSGVLLAAEQAIISSEEFGAQEAPRAAGNHLTLTQPSNIPALPESFSVANVTLQQPHEYSREFSARKATIFDHSLVTHDAPAPASAGETRTANAWQRLADYRGLGRVRLLTLWENPGSSVSLQAGKGGGPSLQWTSRAMNHGGATRGVLDKVFSASIAGAGNAMRASGGPRPSTPANSKLPSRSELSSPAKAP